MAENTYQKKIEVQIDDPEKEFLENDVPKSLIIINIILALVYFFVIVFFFPISNKILFWLLILGEVFHLWQLFTFLYTIWEMKDTEPVNPYFFPPVDVYITVAGEPKEVVEETVMAAKKMDYKDFEVYILNDGYVAKRDNWQEAEIIAKKHGVHCITRKVAGGAKAGNINNALKETKNPFVVIFDADHVPKVNFLQKVMPYFSDHKVAFVQSPQYYKNSGLNYITSGAWDQQALFFGPICKGKNRLNSVTMCGTNMAIRKSVLIDVGGMCEDSIAEDFITGLFIHEKGWKSVYVPEVLARGLAPLDFLSYYKQQFRWARGALDVIFRYYLIFRRRLTWAQKIQYLSSASFYLSGTIIIVDAMLPVVYFFTGAVPFTVSTMILALVFIPYIFFTLYVLQRSVNFCYTFRSLAFSMSSFGIHMKALSSIVLRRKYKFEITSKKKIEGNFLKLVTPHLFYLFLTGIGIGVASYKFGPSASLVSNGAWALLNVVVFSEFIAAAMPSRKNPDSKEVVTEKTKEKPVPAKESATGLVS